MDERTAVLIACKHLAAEWELVNPMRAAANYEADGTWYVEIMPTANDGDLLDVRGYEVDPADGDCTLLGEGIEYLFGNIAYTEYSYTPDTDTLTEVFHEHR